jgi:hypothetical protein
MKQSQNEKKDIERTIFAVFTGIHRSAVQEPGVAFLSNPATLTSLHVHLRINAFNFIRIRIWSSLIGQFGFGSQILTTYRVGRRSQQHGERTGGTVCRDTEEESEDNLIP